jgi:hypothetical protein
MVLTLDHTDQASGGEGPHELARWSYAIVPGEHFRHIKRVGKVECVVSGYLSRSGPLWKGSGFVSLEESDRLIGLDTELELSLVGESWAPPLGQMCSDAEYQYSISISRGVLGECDWDGGLCCVSSRMYRFQPLPPAADWVSSDFFECITRGQVTRKGACDSSSR